MVASPYIHCADGHPKVLHWCISTIDTRKPELFPCEPVHFALNWEKVGAGSELERMFLRHYFPDLKKPSKGNLPVASGDGVQVRPIAFEISIGRVSSPPDFVWKARKLFDQVDAEVWSVAFDEAVKKFHAGTTKMVEFVADYFEDYDGQWLDVARATHRHSPDRVILSSSWSANQHGYPTPQKGALTLEAITAIGHFCDVVSRIVCSQWAQGVSALRVQRHAENDAHSEIVQFEAPSEEMLRSVMPLFRQVLEAKHLDDLISKACSAYIAIARGHIKAVWVEYEMKRMQQSIQSPGGIMSFPRKPEEPEPPSLKELFEAVGYGLRVFHANPRSGTEHIKQLLEAYPREYVINALDSGLRALLVKLVETRNVMAPDLRHWIDHHGAPKPDTVELFTS